MIMTLLAFMVLVAYISWLVFEIVNAPTIEDQQEKEHEECIKARHAS